MAPVRSWIAFNAAALVLPLAAAAPASAQREETFRGLHMDYRTAREYVMEGKDYAVQNKEALKLDMGPAAKRIDGTLDDSLTGMNCAGNIDIGPRVAKLYRETPTVMLGRGEVKGMAKTVTLRDDSAKAIGHMVTVSNKLPDAPRVLSIPLAREAFRILYASMPDSVEKRYMEASFATRAWTEVGGRHNTLPVIDPDTGYKDKEMESVITAWYSGAPSDPKVKTLAQLKTAAQEKVLELERLEADRMEHEYTTHHPSAELDAAIEKFAGSREKLAAIESARNVHSQFMADESAWQWNRQGQF